jgi:hypothetical protein
LSWQAFYFSVSMEPCPLQDVLGWINSAPAQHMESPMGGIPTEHEDGERDDESQDIELDPRIQDAIGKSLKAHYDDLISAPIPDRLLVLLAELEAKERRNDQ